MTVAALVLAIFPIQSRAQDTDLDGFTDQQEIDGITFIDGTVFPGASSGLPRELCMHPGEQDLFVILVPAAPTNLPADPLEFVYKPEAEGGVAITCHMITPAQAGPGRGVTHEVDANGNLILDEFGNPIPIQRAVRVTESLDPDGDVLGIANYGTPNGIDYATVFTERIKNHVNSVCSGANVCIDNATGLSGTALIDLYIKHTIAHEVGHMIMLAEEYNRRFGGYHYKAGSEVVMEQWVTYTSKQGGRNVTFYISTEYAAPSQVAAALK
jgi:hypothetical protein